MLTDDMRYKLVHALEQDPSVSQRDLARKLGVSLELINHCLQALTYVGLVTIKHSGGFGRAFHMYRLTSLGLQDKGNLPLQFLKTKTWSPQPCVLKSNSCAATWSGSRSTTAPEKGRSLEQWQ